MTDPLIKVFTITVDVIVWFLSSQCDGYLNNAVHI